MLNYHLFKSSLKPSHSPPFQPLICLTLTLLLTIPLTQPIQALPTCSHDPSNPSSTSTNTTTRPLKIKNTTELGNINSLTTSVVRDLGFAGQIGPYILLSFGDTLFTNKSTHPTNPSKDPTQFLGMTSNSIALATHDATTIIDPTLNPQTGWPEQFVPVHKHWHEDMSTHSVGITNVIDTTLPNNPPTGLIFTLLNHRPGGINHILGAGIATITIDTRTDPPQPHATRTAATLWSGDDEPWYGDVGAIRTTTHLYAYGHKKDNPWVYLTRAPLTSALDISSYEYWHGTSVGWTRERLTTSNTGESQSVFWQINQGQVIYSAYLGQFLFVYCDNFWSSRVLMRTAERPEGPWGVEVEVCKVRPVREGGTIYAAAPWPHLDSSGKTLVVAFTNHPNCVQAVRVEFE